MHFLICSEHLAARLEVSLGSVVDSPIVFLRYLLALGLAQDSSLRRMKHVQFISFIDHTGPHEGDYGWRSPFSVSLLLSERCRGSHSVHKPLCFICSEVVRLFDFCIPPEEGLVSMSAPCPFYI